MFNIAIGYITRLNWDFKDIFPIPNAPSTYKDPKKIADYEARAAEKAHIEAASKPLTATFKDVFIYNMETKERIKTGATILDTEFKDIVGRIFVIKANLFLKMALHEYFDVTHKPLADEHKWAVRSEVSGYPYMCDGVEQIEGAPGIVDPLRALLGSQADHVDSEALVTRYTRDTDARDLETAEGRAVLTAHLATMIGA